MTARNGTIEISWAVIDRPYRFKSTIAQRILFALVCKFLFKLRGDAKK